MPDDFFAQEQKMAAHAMMNCCREAWQAIEQDTNIKPLIRKRPLTSVAVAAAGGLVAGYLLTPPRSQRPESTPHRDVDTEGIKPEHQSFLVMLEKELANAILPALRTFAVSSAGMMFSDMHQGHTNGEPSNEQEQHDPPPPQPSIQL